MKRIIDFTLAAIVGIVTSPLFVVVYLLVRATSSGPALYWSDRVGKNNRIFRMPKFRTMRTDAPQVAAHLLSDPRTWMTPVGAFLRSTSLDEMPQLWSILRGDMSIVGPRPALFNQYDLTAERTRCGVHLLTPGLTGWAQINGRDELTVVDKTAFDLWYAENRSLWLDLRIMLMTATKVIHSSRHVAAPSQANQDRAAA